MFYLTTISCLSYFLAWFCQARWLVLPEIRHSSVLFRIASFLSILCHGYLLYRQIETPHGQNLYSLVLLSLVFWLLNITIFLGVQLAKVENLALMAYPLTVTVLILSYLYPGSDIVQTNQFHGMASHVMLSLLATSILCLCFLQAVLLTIQNVSLKKHKSPAYLKLLPPLQTMESLLFIFLWLGIACLTFGLVSGFWFQYHHPELKHQPEIVLSFISWAVIGTLLVGRYRLGWRLQKALIGTGLGFTLIFVSYFSTHL